MLSCIFNLFLHDGFKRKKLLDEKEQLHERYAALFGLRNRGGPDAVAAIIASLKCESALLKHEVCIPGQYSRCFSRDLLCLFQLQYRMPVSAVLVYASLL
jgi:hypothetical protein